MADREKMIELQYEAEEHSTDICVYNSDCKDCPGGKYGNKCRDYLKADYLISHGVTVRERGRWNYDGTCGVCGTHILSNHTCYCSYCGADMRGEEDG